MKFVKMSLAAALVLGANAFAVDNIKVSGDAKLYYGTNDAGDNSLFNKGVPVNTPTSTTVANQGGSYADTALRVSITGNLLSNVSFGVTQYAVSTLGLENNLVSQTWTGAHGAEANANNFGYQVNDTSWTGEAWVAASLGKTTFKVGRMALDTPLAFSETWSVAPNTFEGAVVLNQDLPDTTLVAAWVGKGNGTNSTRSFSGIVGVDGVVAADAKFNTFMDEGAYAFAVVNNSYKPLTAQAWYYNVLNVADAMWLQADVNCALVPGLTLGAQYANMATKGLLSGAKDSSGYAAKVGYGFENLKASVAYSTTDKEGTLKLANTGTSNLSGAQSKLYTEAFWNYGYVGAPGAKSMNVTVEYDVKDFAKLGLYYTTVSNDNTAASKSDQLDMDELAVTATKSFGALDATLAYVQTSADNQNVKTTGQAGDAYNTVQAYLKLNF